MINRNVESVIYWPWFARVHNLQAAAALAARLHPPRGHVRDCGALRGVFEGNTQADAVDAFYDGCLVFGACLRPVPPRLRRSQKPGTHSVHLLRLRLRSVYCVIVLIKN